MAKYKITELLEASGITANDETWPKLHPEFLNEYSAFDALVLDNTDGELDDKIKEADEALCESFKECHGWKEAPNDEEEQNDDELKAGVVNDFTPDELKAGVVNDNIPEVPETEEIPTIEIISKTEENNIVETNTGGNPNLADKNENKIIEGEKKPEIKEDIIVNPVVSKKEVFDYTEFFNELDNLMEKGELAQASHFTKHKIPKEIWHIDKPTFEIGRYKFNKPDLFGGMFNAWVIIKK